MIFDYLITFPYDYKKVYNLFTQGIPKVYILYTIQSVTLYAKCIIPSLFV